MKQAKISTQYPDKYGFKAPDGPPVGIPVYSNAN